MKKCGHFKDLILTDYIDGRLDKNAVAALESHLLECSDCSAFFKEVKNTAVSPFHRALQQPPPAGLWEAVKQAVEQEEQPGFGENFINGLKGWMVFPRLVPVAATLVLMLLAGGVSLTTLQADRAQEKADASYLVSLFNAGGGTSSDNTSLGTPIEKYFL
ncbi:MAG: anti-sigma factor [Candidatus Omnitrophica bacterium]|nr:anti-sigma factor [Candidatus Omnitrophota bacterium]MDE2214611.1 anti-sigma factor [Candidatus Omnitrophota bacterium]